MAASRWEHFSHEADIGVRGIGITKEQAFEQAALAMTGVEQTMTDTISRDELKAKIDRGDKFQLVETLPEETFQESHLPGAVNLPPDKIKQQAGRILPDKGADIVVYCASTACTASEDAAAELTRQGYTRVRRYVGGKQDWTDAGLHTESAPQMADVGASI